MRIPRPGLVKSAVGGTKNNRVSEYNRIKCNMHPAGCLKFMFCLSGWNPKLSCYWMAVNVLIFFLLLYSHFTGGISIHPLCHPRVLISLWRLCELQALTNCTSEVKIQREFNSFSQSLDEENRSKQLRLMRGIVHHFESSFEWEGEIVKRAEQNCEVILLILGIRSSFNHFPDSPFSILPCYSSDFFLFFLEIIQ